MPGSVFGVVYNHELGPTLDRWIIRSRAGNAAAPAVNHHAVHQSPAGHDAGSGRSAAGCGNAWNRPRSRRSASFSRWPNRPPSAACATCSVFWAASNCWVAGFAWTLWPRDGFAGAAQKPGRRLRQAGHVLRQRTGNRHEETRAASRIGGKAGSAGGGHRGRRGGKRQDHADLGRWASI